MQFWICRVHTHTHTLMLYYRRKTLLKKKKNNNNFVAFYDLGFAAFKKTTTRP